MDAKEAIKRLKNYPKDSITGTGKLVLSSEIELAISALEKQVPKVPIDYKCPCCGESVFLQTRAGWYQVEHHLKVCENCGQKIDWSKLTFRDRWNYLILKF